MCSITLDSMLPATPSNIRIVGLTITICALHVTCSLVDDLDVMHLFLSLQTFCVMTAVSCVHIHMYVHVHVHVCVLLLSVVAHLSGHIHCTCMCVFRKNHGLSFENA